MGCIRIAFLIFEGKRLTNSDLLPKFQNRCLFHSRHKHDLLRGFTCVNLVDCFY